MVLMYLGKCSATLAHTASSDSAERISGLSTVRSWLSWMADSDIVAVIVDEDMEMLFLRIKVVVVLASLIMVREGCEQVPGQIEVEANGKEGKE